MFGVFPRLFDRNFVIGFFLPTLLGLLAVAWAFPVLTFLEPFRKLDASTDFLNHLAYLSIVVWVGAVLLASVNQILYQILEGYLPPISWLFVLKRWHQRRFRFLKTQYEELINQWREQKEAFPEAAQNRASVLKRRLILCYPTLADEVMPTRFGNIIRAFEVYPREVYKVDAIPVWLRLAAVIPKDFANLVDEARSQTDFFVNLTLIAFIIALFAGIGVGIDLDWRAMPSWHTFRSEGGHHVVVFIAMLMISVFSYLLAIRRAIGWGDLVKSAFDCYLPTLTIQLGFQMPSSEESRREFWREFSAMITYQQPMETDRWPLVHKPEATDSQLPPAEQVQASNAARSDDAAEAAEPTEVVAERG
jgi:hypothetical protein